MNFLSYTKKKKTHTGLEIGFFISYYVDDEDWKMEKHTVAIPKISQFG